MAIGAFVGILRSGKTLSMVEAAYNHYKQGAKIYSNIHLNSRIIPHTFINSIEQLDKIRGDINHPAILLLDEIWRWLDSRKWKGSKNDIITKIIMFSGKRGIIIYCTSQNFHQIEKRIRDVTDTIIEPVLSNYRWVMLKGKKVHIGVVCSTKYYSVIPRPGQGNLQSKKPIKSHKFLTPYIMTLYDTREEVEDVK
jgi:hypothetical protein